MEKNGKVYKTRVGGLGEAQPLRCEGVDLERVSCGDLKVKRKKEAKGSCRNKCEL